MRVVTSAFYGEGPTDQRFLPILIQRTISHITDHRGISTTDVLEPSVLTSPMSSQSDRLLDVAKNAAQFDLMFIHADADAPGPDRALTERFHPGLALIREQPSDTVCRQIVPLIPVRMIEAWMLADGAALRSVIGTDANDDELGIPTSAARVELITDPKAVLRMAAERAVARRRKARRRIDISTIHVPLAEQISIEQLRTVPSFRRFIEELTLALVELRICN